MLMHRKPCLIPIEQFEGYKWAASWQNQQNDCASSEDSEQPGHPPSLLRVFAVRWMGSWVPNVSSCGQWRLWSDWADAVFAGRTVILLVLSWGGSNTLQPRTRWPFVYQTLKKYDHSYTFWAKKGAVRTVYRELHPHPHPQHTPPPPPAKKKAPISFESEKSWGSCADLSFPRQGKKLKVHRSEADYTDLTALFHQDYAATPSRETLRVFQISRAEGLEEKRSRDWIRRQLDRFQHRWCLWSWWQKSMRKPTLAICEQQRCRSACASAQSDQHLCCSLLR